MKKRIFGSNFYINLKGIIEDSEGNQVPMRKNQNGNLVVKINNKYKSVTKLVAETYMGQSTKRIVHLDGDKTNNAPWNLEYINHSKSKHSTNYQKYLKIPATTVNKIYAMFLEEVTIREISEIFKMTNELILFIIRENTKNNSKNT